MKIACLAFFLAAVCLFQSACAGIAVKNADGKHWGIPVYIPEPYVLASPVVSPSEDEEEAKKEAEIKNDAKPKKIVTKNGWTYTIVWLRGSEPSYYLKPQGSLGSTTASFTLNPNGTLAELNTTSDLQLDELITAIASVIPAIAPVSQSNSNDTKLDFQLYKIDLSVSPPKLRKVTE